MIRGEPIQVTSPDGRVVISLEVRDFEGSKACAVYSVRYRGRTAIAPSRIGLDLEGEARTLGEGVRVEGPVRRTRSSATWNPVCGERATVHDRYEQAIVDLVEAAETGGRRRNRLRLRLTLRAYDEGAAFCATISDPSGVPVRTGTVLMRERTEFRFERDHPCWATYTAQGVYSEIPLSRVNPGCERPLVVRLADDCWAAVAEARMVDYARLKLAPLPGVSFALTAELGSPVTVPGTLPYTTPWRVVMLADSPARLLENNDLLLNLNAPCALRDTSWIKPGKVVREVTLSTTGAKSLIDFCARRGVEYIEFDAGWYGPERDPASDPRAVSPALADRPIGGLDLAEVIRYGEGKGVGVLLYVNRFHLRRDLDEILPLYRKWGVKGIKFGFIDVGTQEATVFFHEAVRKCAAHRLVVDIHDEYRPTGWSRTYPNLLTQEGIRGDEESPTNEQTLTILFTRMLAGAADNTVCYYDARVDRMATHAYQLAKAVCFYSPLQFLYWYDRPYQIPEGPELEFFDRLPTVWDETKVLHGAIGEYAVIARRRGAEWFLGFMNAGKSRSFEVPLDFLAPGQRYIAHLYSDDPEDTTTRTRVRVDRYAVETGRTVLRLTAGVQGGQAVRIAPAAPAEERYPAYAPPRP